MKPTDAQVAAADCLDRKIDSEETGNDWEELIDIIFWPPLGVNYGEEVPRDARGGRS